MSWPHPNFQNAPLNKMSDDYALFCWNKQFLLGFIESIPGGKWYQSSEMSWSPVSVFRPASGPNSCYMNTSHTMMESPSTCMVPCRKLTSIVL